jgi:hypothetical protein
MFYILVYCQILQTHVHIVLTIPFFSQNPQLGYRLPMPNFTLAECPDCVCAAFTGTYNINIYKYTQYVRNFIPIRPLKYDFQEKCSRISVPIN